MLRLTAITLVFFLSGCTALNNMNQRYQGNENSKYYRVPVDSTLVLNQSLTIPIRHKRVYFQDGRPLAFYEVNEYQPWCVLRMRAKKDVAQKLVPDEFVVSAVRREDLYEVARLPVLVAQFDPGGTEMTYQVIASRMELSSDIQPDVQSLSCSRWRIPQDRYWVTIRDVRESLGSIFDLRLRE